MSDERIEKLEQLCRDMYAAHLVTRKDDTQQIIFNSFRERMQDLGLLKVSENKHNARKRFE